MPAEVTQGYPRRETAGRSISWKDVRQYPMDETYIGWDGETYPSPPPEGWYKASDGRYWAPDSGPNPPPTGAGAAAAAATAPSAPSDGGAPLAGDAQATSQFSAPPPAAGPGLGADGPTTDEQPLPGALGAPGGLAGAGPPAGGPPGFQPQSGSAGKSSSGVSRLLLVGLGIVGAIVVVGGAIVFTQRGGGDDTAAEDTTTTVEGAEEAPDEESGDSTTTTADPDESASSTSAADESSTTTAVEPAGDPQAFRAILTDNGLSSEQLTDEQIQDFGDTYCGFANLSDDEDAFEELRQSTIDDADSDLSDEGLGTIIDAAVIVFCPDQAERLDIDS